METKYLHATPSQQNQILIAIFDGKQPIEGYSESSNSYYYYYNDSELQDFEAIPEYKHDFNSLMNVVDKIESLDYFGNSFELESIGKSAKFILDDGTRILHDCPASTKIESIFFAVLEFINWYNDRK